jgi:mono/diheme cytochrome c family protein
MPTPKRFTNRPGRPGFAPRALFGPAAALAIPGLLAFVSTLGNAPRVAASSDAEMQRSLDRQFTTTVRPFLKTYCAPCHGKADSEAALNVETYGNLAAVIGDDTHWNHILDKLAAGQMPPSTARKQPSAVEREAVLAWINAMRQWEALQRKDTGDPGPVLARRLSNAEYDYTIRDLTGVDLHPTREFPVDPANQEGFDNSGESLTLSGALVKKYVDSATDIANHMVLTSTGITFATHPVLVETDQDKFCILRIVDFYKHQPTDFADYFAAAWRYRYRDVLHTPKASLASLAADAHISPRYLTLVWETLNGSDNAVGPLATLRTKWNALPPPDSANPGAPRDGCTALRDWVAGLRKKVACRFDNLQVPNGFSTGGQVFVLWKDRQYAWHRRGFEPTALQAGGVPQTHVIPAHKSKGPKDPDRPEKTVSDPVDPDLFVPEDDAARAPYLAAFKEFSSVFPDAFYISERGRMFVNEPGDAGRLLSAGLHNSMGYFRDDNPLDELILDDAGRRKLDTLWQDFDMVASVPERMQLEFCVYERAESGTITDPEFNFARAEDKSTLSNEKLKLLGDLYYAKAKRNGGQPAALDAITDFFNRVPVRIRTVEQQRLAAEPLQRNALIEFAHRAYRRPLTVAEHADILAFYEQLRHKDGLTHENAMRNSVVRILLSPNFLFRMDSESSPIAEAMPNRSDARLQLARAGVPVGKRRGAPTPAPTAGTALEPLSDYDLASRLSYFLWSSMPDDELLAHAAAGDLHRPDVLTAQTRRMLKDPKVRSLALEFGANWLDFRRFDQENAVDRNRFPTFTNDLRSAMFEEPVRFLTDIFQNNRPVVNMIYGKYTFVNPVLAQHYGIPDKAKATDSWTRVDDADRYGRGGMLPMAVFLTKNSPGLRTSPVKRGYWVVKRLLGEYIPPPPATVPALPKDESQMGDLTLRMALARHRQDPACAGCHARFDSYGLVFEGYGPIGELRTHDLGGKPVDARAPFPGGSEYEGVSGLQGFIGKQRQKDFVNTIDRKLYSYALGRTLQPSDTPTLSRIYGHVVTGNYRFDSLVESIVTSQQFRYRRAPAPRPATVALGRN